MKSVYIIVEGHTEKEFVNTIISQYLLEKGIYSVRPILIYTSRNGRGGMVNYNHLKNTIKQQLFSNKTDFIVTTLVDFYRLPHNMPNYEKCMKANSDDQKALALEAEINKDINDARFFSYIQLHEFEALLFSNNNGFKEYFLNHESDQTAAIIRKYKNPEDINSSPQGAPSKRILAIKKDYNKPVFGNVLALEVGIEAMLDKCPRFSAWIQMMIKMASPER
jgi:hypothetical protein